MGRGKKKGRKKEKKGASGNITDGDRFDIISRLSKKRGREEAFSHPGDESITRRFGFPVSHNDKVEAAEPNHGHNSLLRAQINLLMRIHHRRSPARAKSSQLH